jgi:hypothetical protein
MYKGNKVANVDVHQVASMEKSGWSMQKGGKNATELPNNDRLKIQKQSGKPGASEEPVTGHEEQADSSKAKIQKSKSVSAESGLVSKKPIKKPIKKPPIKKLIKKPAKKS